MGETMGGGPLDDARPNARQGVYPTATASGPLALAFFFSLFAALVVAFAFSGSAPAASDSGAVPPAISSDKADYAPGELVTLNGSNWRAGETVTIDVNDDEGQSWRRTVDVVADAEGKLIDQFNLPDHFVAVYTVTATGPLSGTAVTSFTDGNVRARSNAVGITFSLNWTEYSNSQACTGSVNSSGTEASTGFSGGARFSRGVANQNSITLQAATFSDGGLVFAGWTGDTVTDTFLPFGSRTICIPGNFTGVREYVANYVANAAPVAVNDSYSVNEDAVLTVAAPGVLGNDTDANGQPLTAALVTGPSNGSLTLNANGSFTYTPNANFFGSDSFTYRANDGFANSNTATVSLTVNGINDAPSFTKGADQTVDEDAGAQSVNPWATSISPGPPSESAQSVSFLVTANTNPALFAAGPAVSPTGVLTYTPAANANGPATITLKIKDSGGTANGGVDESATQSFVITVTAVDDAPVAVGDAATVVEDSGAGTISVLANDTDVDGGPKSIASVTQPANGTVAVTNGGADLSYAPNPNYCNGGDPKDTFTYTLNGGSTATVSVTVTCVDDAPVAVGDAATVVEDSGASAIDVLANDTDVDGGPKSIASVTQPANGMVVITGGGADLSYAPNPNYCNGGDPKDTFTYTLNGGSTATVSVTVTCVNDAPVAVADSATTDEDTFVDIVVSGNDTDVDNANAALSVAPGSIGAITGGTAVLQGDGRTVRFTPAANANNGNTPGGFSFTYKAYDGTLASANTATVTISVTAVNDAPVAVADNATTDEDTFVDVVVSGNDTDVDNANAELSVASGSIGAVTGGTAVLQGDGRTVRFTPAANANNGNTAGGFGFTYKAYDGALDSANAATVTISVTAVNDAPEVTVDDATITVDEGQSAENSGTWVDVDGDVTLSASVGTVTKNNDGTWSWSYGTTDGPAQSGTVTVTADDGEATDSVSFELSVVNVAPTATFNAPEFVDEGSSIALSLTAPSDPSAVDTAAGFTYAFDCGGGYGPFGASNEASCLTSNNESRTVKGKIKDKDDGETEYIATVTIQNVVPVVTAGADQPTDEGTLTSFSLGSFVDPGADSPWNVVVDWGDGSTDTTFPFNSMTPALASSDPYSLGMVGHKYDDNDAYTVTVTVTDKDGGFGSDTFDVTAANVAPSAALGNNGPVDEGSPATVSFSNQADVSSADTTAGFHYAYDCAGGTFPTVPTYAGSSTVASHQCTFADDGTFTVSAAIVDKDGGYSVYETDVVVENVAPTVAISGAPATSPEGTPISLTSSVDDPGTEDTHTYAWSVTKNGVAYGSGGTGASFSFTPDDNGSYVVSLTVTDDDGGSGTDSETITVTNVAPTVSMDEAPGASPEGTEIDLTGDFTDPGSADTHSFAWSVTKDGNAYAAGTTEDFSFTPDDNGSYVVTLTVTDDDGGSDNDDKTIAVPNVAPTADLGNDGPVDEGSPATVSFSNQADVSSADTTAGFHYAYDCAGGSFPTAPTYAGSSTDESHECMFADDGTFTVSAAIVDKDGGYSVHTTDVVVENVAPTVTISNAPATSPEGTPINLTGSFTDPGADTHTREWSVTKNGSAYGSGGSGASYSFTPDDNGTYVVTLTVADDDGGSGRDSETIAVTNVAPTAAINGAPATSPEGTEISLTSSVTDPGTADTHSYAWSVSKNGNAFASGTSEDFSFTPDDNGTYVVTLTATDDDGGAGSDSKTIAVTNVAPSAAIGGAPETSPEGTEISLTSSVTDPGTADTHTFAWSVTKNGNAYAAGTSANFSFTPNDNGSYVATLTVTDDDGGSGSDTKTISVPNVAPTATFNTPASVNEGSPFTLSLTNPSDPSSADTSAGFTYAFDCGTGSGYGPFTTASTATCPTNDSGSRSVKGQIKDKDGGVTAYEATVTVSNVAPTATFTAAPTSVNEGTPFTLSLTNPSDPSSADTAAGFTYAFDCGTGSGYGSYGSSNTASCPTTDNGTRSVKGKIRDKDGGETEYSASVTVTNQNPTVTITSPPYGSLYTMGSTVTVVASFNDLGTGDTHTCKISWDNGLGETTGSVPEPNGSGTCTGSNTLTAAGVYTIRVTITDDDGGSGYDETLVVVYDPNVGHVTGGGWINSPAGAYVPDPTLTGRANFGFNAKYLKGARTPSGSTEFQFHAGNLNFHSTNYEWLVVAGAKGQFKGTGTINGSGNYGFLLTVTDGQLTGGGGTDRFRMKIWDKGNGDTIVYDNASGSDDIDSSSTQQIAGGSIVIHKGK